MAPWGKALLGRSQVLAVIRLGREALDRACDETGAELVFRRGVPVRAVWQDGSAIDLPHWLLTGGSEP